MTHRPPSPSPPGRSRSLTAVLILLVWCVAALAAFAFATDTKIGPVLVKFSRGHGLHLGDALVIVAATLTAIALTWLLVRPTRLVRREVSTRTVGR